MLRKVEILVIAIVVILVAVPIHLFSKTIVFCRNENQPERLMIDVPDKWNVVLEPFGTDFIIHNMVVTNTQGDETLRMGWLADPAAPTRITDDMVDSFKSQISYWLSSHQLSGQFVSVQEMTIGNREARFFQLELNENGNKSDVDYYLILGENAVYVISISHGLTADLTEMSTALKSIIVKNEVFAKLLPPPADPDDASVNPTPVRHSSNNSGSSSSTFASVFLPGNEDDQLMFVFKIGMVVVVMGGGLLFIVAGFMRSHH